MTSVIATKSDHKDMERWTAFEKTLPGAELGARQANGRMRIACYQKMLCFKIAVGRIASGKIHVNEALEGTLLQEEVLSCI
ncbi:hypothetical protein SAMN05216548_1284 [Faunimonas pinastri]|uniref:Uncharacterized protein n=1 Tax=Faunimonas pinastri TaxID=1855383 RepID=A0A1H9QFW4_9HYPH|nr:hypothetical protein SAMN05216548_1284 [Faunimonas pinastri]